MTECLDSRPSLKKYVKANNKTAEGPTFDKLFNNALSKGVEKGLFAQPKGKQYPTVVDSRSQLIGLTDKLSNLFSKVNTYNTHIGPSGAVKLAAKTKPAATDEKKPATDKPAAKVRWLLFHSSIQHDLLLSSLLTIPQKATATTKKTAAAPKKSVAAKAAAPKKATATKKAPAKAAPVKKAAAPKKVATKKTTPAPAIVDKPVITGKTKTGRITKTTQKSAPPAAKKVTKIPAKSKRATPKKATPKKAWN